MNTLPKTLVYILAACLLAATSYSKPVEIVKPKVIGLYFHASWCASCKTLDPEMDAAKEELKKSPFLLVTLDVSNKVTQHQAGMAASAIGLGELYEKTGVKTGFIILVNPETGEELARITKTDNAAAIVSKIQAFTGA